MSAFKIDNGDEIRVRLDMNAYEGIMSEFGTYETMEKERSEPATRLITVMKLATIFANAAAIYDGRKERYNREWLQAHIRPVELAGVTLAVNLAFAEGMAMDTKSKASDEPRDLVLEELEKKTAEA